MSREAAFPGASCIPEAVLAAYRCAIYEVYPADDCAGFVMRVDLPSDALEAVFATYAVSAAAFITACNPAGQALASEPNELAQGRLLDDVTRAGYRSFPGAGRDPQGSWPSEASLLILEIRESEAKALGTAYGQNAILFVGADCTPRLVALR